MADSYTTNFKFIKPEPGGSLNTWGTKLNDNAVDMLDELLGFEAHTVTGDFSVSMSNGDDTSTALPFLHRLGGTPAAAFSMTWPALNYAHLIHNASGVTATPKVAAGSGVSLSNGGFMLVAYNSTYGDITNISPNRLPGNVEIGGRIDMAGQVKGVTAGSAATDAVNKAQMEAAIAASVPAGTAGTLFNSSSDTTRDYLINKVTTNFTSSTTTQLAGLTSFTLSTQNSGANEKLLITQGYAYVGGFLNGGTKSSTFIPVVGSEYNCDFTASSWTINLTGMTAPQVGQRIKLNCFGNFPPFLLGTVNGLTNFTLDPGFDDELAYSSASWGWN